MIEAIETHAIRPRAIQPRAWPAGGFPGDRRGPDRGRPATALRPDGRKIHVRLRLV
jgi:hypothetical protein